MRSSWFSDMFPFSNKGQMKSLSREEIISEIATHDKKLTKRIQLTKAAFEGCIKEDFSGIKSIVPTSDAMKNTKLMVLTSNRQNENFENIKKLSDEFGVKFNSRKKEFGSIHQKNASEYKEISKVFELKGL